MLNVKARPGWQAGGRAAGRSCGYRAARSHCSDDDAANQAIALAVFKRNRECIVAKLTRFCDNGSERILAIAHRNQSGVSTTISVPLVVLDFAEAHNVHCLYFRRDTTGEMWRVSLQELRKVGYLQTSDGIPERFIKIAQMQRCNWRKWQFATKTIVLDTNRTQGAEQAQQLALPL